MIAKEAVYTTEEINGASTGDIIIVNLPSELIVRNVTLDLTDVSGLVTPAVVSIGQNVGTYNNLITATAMTGLSVVNTIFPIIIDSIVPVMQASTNIVLRVVTAAIATTYKFKCTIIGRKRN